MLKTILVIIGIILLNFVVRVVVNLISNKKLQNDQDDEINNDKVRVLQYSALLRWIFILCSIVFDIVAPILIYLFPYDAKGYEIYVCLLIWGTFGLFSTVLAYVFNMWKIEVHKEYIVYRGYLGKKRKYYFKDLELDCNNMGTRLYFKKDGKKVCSWHIGDVDDTALLKRYKKVITEENKTIKEEQNNINEQQCEQEEFEEQTPTKEKTVIKPSWFMFTIAILATIVFAFFVVMFFTSTYKTEKEKEITHVVMYILSGLWGFALLGFLAYFFGYRITLKEETFVIRKLFIKREYPYKDVTWKLIKNHVVFYYKDKKISAWLVYIDSIKYLTWKTTEDRR